MELSALARKYGGMREPGWTLKVGGQTLETGQDARLVELACDLTCGQEAGSLWLEAELDPQGERGGAWLDALRLGVVCSLGLGYGRERTEVFCGFVYDLRWRDPLERGAARLTALCLDARGQLMLSACADAGAARTASQLVEAVLGQPCCTRLAPSRRVSGVPEEWNLPVQRLGRTDYEVIRALAELVGYEFYVYAGELYFGPSRPERAAAVTFDGPDGLLELCRGRTLAGQCAAVAVSGADDKGARVFARQERAGESGFGAGRMDEALTGQIQSPQPAARTMAQAQYLARTDMERRQRRAGGLRGRSVGLPELRPGRFVETRGLSAPVNGVYYVRTVRHTLDSSGFETAFETEDEEAGHGGG